MIKTFIVKNLEGQTLGEISYSEDWFRVDISSVEEKKEIEDCLNKCFKEGLRFIGGNKISKNPVKPGNPLFLGAVWRQLITKGYTTIEKKK